MDQKIKLKYILSYIPPSISNILLNSSYTDDDMFPSKKNHKSLEDSALPITKTSNISIVMEIRLEGFISVYSLLLKDDEKCQKERLHSEYLNFSYSRMMFQISAIITQHGGEIIKSNNGHYTVIWECNDIKEKSIFILTALQCGVVIMKKVNNQEISRGIKLNICIGIGIGELSFGIVGGVNQRIDYICFGKALEEADQCIANFEGQYNYGIIVPQSIYSTIINEKYELVVNEINEKNNFFLIDIEQCSNSCRNFNKFKIKKFHSRSLGRTGPELAEKKIATLKALVPTAVIQYIDTDFEKSLKELRIVTLMTLKIKIPETTLDNIKEIQKLVVNLQKCTYLTHGSLIYISKENNYLFVKCSWGVPPFSFYDDPARAVSTGLMIKFVVNEMGYSIGIGISTGADFTGFNGVQGNRKALEVIGGKVIISDLLMEEAINSIEKNIAVDEGNEKISASGEIYLDKTTMKMIQKWYRCVFVNNSNNKYGCEFDIYTPSIQEGDFIPNQTDPFPFIRTHKFNSFNPKINGGSSGPVQGTGEIKRRLTIVNITQLGNNLPNNSVSFSSMSTTPQETDLRTYHLKKSQTMFGRSKELNRMLGILNEALLNKKKQFILVKGYLGSGKSLFLRKAMNNFIGTNQDLASIYYSRYQFLFCSNQNHITRLLPYNCVSIIIHKIYRLLIQLGKRREICEMIAKSKMTKRTLLEIQYILSLGNKKREFDIFKDLQISPPEPESQKEYNFPIDAFDKSFPFESDMQKINVFFLYLISIYKIHLNDISKKATIPLIFIIDDIQNGDIHSLKFLNDLYKKDIKSLNPLIVIYTYQVPFHPLLSSTLLNPSVLFSFEIFQNIDYQATTSNPKIVIGFSIDPLQNKRDIEKMIIFCFKDLVMKIYKTNLERVDLKIIDIILQKTFHGIPLIAIHLVESLIHSEKYIQTLSGEFIITSEMIDNNDIFEWSDFILPNLHTKICGELIDSIFTMKETMIVKQASIIGTMFDVATLDEINPYKNVMNVNSLCEIFFMLENENLLEIYNDYYGKNKKLVCKFTFPLFRESLYQRIPLEQRSRTHLIIARLLETSKVKYFSIENENKMLKRHLQKSEMSVNSEIEKKKVKTIEDIVNSRDALNLNNMKILLVKNICSNFYAKYDNLFMEGFLYKKSDGKLTWEQRYFILNQESMEYYYTSSDYKEKKAPLGKFSLDNIFKAEVSTDKDNYTILTLSVSGWEKKGQGQEGRTYFFSGEKREDIYKWAISLNFLLVKAKYNSYIKNFDFVKFPLFKMAKISKEKYIMNISLESQMATSAYPQNNNRSPIEYTYYINASESAMNMVKEYLFPLKILVRGGFGVVLGMIQGKVINWGMDDGEQNKSGNSDEVNDEDDNTDYLKLIYTPKMLEEPLKKYIEKEKEEERKRRVDEDERNEENKKKEEEKRKEKEEFKEGEYDPDKIYDNFPSITDIEPIAKNTDVVSEDSFDMNLQDNQIGENFESLGSNMKNETGNFKGSSIKNQVNSSIPSKKLLPNDFVPRKCLTSRGKELPNFPSQSYMNKSNNNTETIKVINDLPGFKDKNFLFLSNQIKGKKLFDDPRYSYVEQKEKELHNKVHKSNLFKTLKSPKKSKIP